MSCTLMKIKQKYCRNNCNINRPWKIQVCGDLLALGYLSNRTNSFKVTSIILSKWHLMLFLYIWCLYIVPKVEMMYSLCTLCKCFTTSWENYIILHSACLIFSFLNVKLLCLFSVHSIIVHHIMNKCVKWN